MSKPIYSFCHYCVSLCGTEIHVENNRIKSIEPDRKNPFSWKDFCRKGKTAAQVIDHPLRIKTPMKRVGDKYVPATYEEAVADISKKFNQIIRQHGQDSIGCYSGNPLGFSFANSMFLGGWLDAVGTGNRYWVGSVDQNNLCVVQEEMYGSELISFPADVDNCDYFLLLGMDPAQSKFSWVEIIPNGWARVLDAQNSGAKIVIVDPRHSTSASKADLHVAIQPGQDWAFLLAILKVIFDQKLENLSETVPLSGVETVRELALSADMHDLSGRCDVDIETINQIAIEFASAKTAVCLSHTGLSHSENGTIAEWLGHVLNAVTNRLDVVGGKRCEKGYVDLPKVWESMAPSTKHRSRIRDLPSISGYHSIAELPDEILTPGEGQIRGMMMVAGNPVISGPEGNTLDEALADLDFLVVIDLVQRESHRHADWLIPGTHFLERGGLHPLLAGLMDKPFAQYARQVVKPPSTIKEEWEFFVDIALTMNIPLFGKKGMNTLIKVSRWLAKVTGYSALAFDPEWFARLMVLWGREIKYKDIIKHKHGWTYRKKRYGDLANTLLTEDKTVHCAPPKFIWSCNQLLQSTYIRDKQFPYLMVNRRNRESMNSWLNETDGMFVGDRNNYVEIDKLDARKLSLIDGQQVRLTSEVASIELPVRILEKGKLGIVTVAHGWGSRIFDPENPEKNMQHGVNRNLLVSRKAFDPLSQIPTMNGVPVKIEPLAVKSNEQMNAGSY